MPIYLIDPTDESETVHRQLAPRGMTLDGATVALIDIRKARGDVLLDRLEQRIMRQHPTATVLRMAKPTFTKPAPADFIDEVVATGANFAIEGLAD